MNIPGFKRLIRKYYEAYGRHSLPWRQTRDPYRILVSEIMLQQTQVSRVMKKYEEFLAAFPTVRALAEAPTSKVLALWQGLGYNRRALNLKRAAEAVMRDFGGKFPETSEGLESLPGIGQSTRGAVMAFAFGKATPFIETNVRAIYIHHFFEGKDAVHDKEIMPLIEKTLDKENPRDWYYALMDYGVHLKAAQPNPSRRSKHHAKQSRFEGSNRQVRAKIVRYVLSFGENGTTKGEILAHIGKTEHDVKKNIADLAKEGFIEMVAGSYRAKS